MTPRTTGLPMSPRHGAPYVFDPGTLCLELLLTGGPGPYAVHEVLHEPRRFAEWLALCRLRLDPGQVSVSAAELAEARATRDALWRLALARARGGVLLGEDVAAVNRAAARPPLAPALSADGTRAWVLPATASEVLSAFARDAVELFTGPFAERVRECAASDCGLVFVDTSRPGRRRWCSMERCGNRQKVRSLRARRGSGEERP